MPCDSVTTQSVNMKNANPDVLIRALEADRWWVREVSGGLILANRLGDSLRWERGVGLVVRGVGEAVEEVTRAYGREAVTWAAKRAGWEVKQVGENKLVVSRG